MLNYLQLTKITQLFEVAKEGRSMVRLFLLQLTDGITFLPRTKFSKGTQFLTPASTFYFFSSQQSEAPHSRVICATVRDDFVTDALCVFRGSELGTGFI